LQFADFWQDFTNRSAGLAGYKFLTKNLFQQFFKMKTFTPSSKNILYFSCYDVFNWVTPGQSATSCLELFRIFIMMQRSSFKQIIVT